MVSRRKNMQVKALNKVYHDAQDAGERPFVRSKSVGVLADRHKDLEAALIGVNLLLQELDGWEEEIEDLRDDITVAIRTG